jgi:hypothetical protein
LFLRKIFITDRPYVREARGEDEARLAVLFVLDVFVTSAKSVVLARVNLTILIVESLQFIVRITFGDLDTLLEVSFVAVNSQTEYVVFVLDSTTFGEDTSGFWVVAPLKFACFILVAVCRIASLDPNLVLWVVARVLLEQTYVLADASQSDCAMFIDKVIAARALTERGRVTVDRRQRDSSVTRQLVLFNTQTDSMRSLWMKSTGNDFPLLFFIIGVTRLKLDTLLAPFRQVGDLPAEILVLLLLGSERPDNTRRFVDGLPLPFVLGRLVAVVVLDIALLVPDFIAGLVVGVLLENAEIASVRVQKSDRFVFLYNGGNSELSAASWRGFHAQTFLKLESVVTTAANLGAVLHANIDCLTVCA